MILAVLAIVVYFMFRDAKRYQQRINKRLNQNPSTSLPKRTGRVDVDE